MHISLRQTVDRINSQRADQLLDQEIDLELNRAMQRFINQRYGKNNVYQEGFEESQKRIDELRTLLVEYEAGVTFKEELRPGRIFVDQFQLPANYMYLVNQRSKIFTENCQPIESTLVASDDQDIHYFTFNFDQLIVNENEFVDSIRLQNTEFNVNPTVSNTVWQPSTTLNSLGYNSNLYPQFINEVITDMLENSAPGFEIYWESYGPLNSPNNFIVVVDINIHDWFIWDLSFGTTTPLVSIDSSNNQIAFVPPHFHDQSGILTRVPESSTVTEDTVLNKFSQQDDIYRLLDDPFNATTHTSPLTTIRGNFIDIYTNAIFITSSAKITYLRKPQPISLSLGYNCELPDHTHEEVIAMAASSILEESSDPRYKTQLGEAMNRE